MYETTKRKLKRKWAQLEAMVGTDERLDLIAKDILDHWERRKEIINGKAMIVAMSRRICVDLYNQFIKLHPEWHSEDDDKGCIKVVMTGAASDPPEYIPHIRNKPRLKDVERRFKDSNDTLEIVIVRDMWLTGFDAPIANTLYMDKPMKGHGLMQAIARVNRVFKDKPSGLVVDYLGLAEQLKHAVGRYGGQGGEPPGFPIEEALTLLEEKFQVIKDMFHSCDYSGYFSHKPTDRLSALSIGANHICQSDELKKRFLDAMVLLNKAAGIAIHIEEARHMRDELAFFQSVQKNLVKYTGGEGTADESLNAAIKQIVSEAVTSDEVVDIFAAAGFQTPDISILSDEFLETLQKNPHRNLQLELLKKLINDEVRAITRKNVVQSRKFSEMLENTLLKYQNRTLEAAEVILELIKLAKQIRDSSNRGDNLGLTDDEMAFYDALVVHGDVKNLMGDDILSKIAHDLVGTIRNSVTIDWTQKESVRAKMRTRIKRLLRKHGYPPEQATDATETVIEQAEQISRDWAEAA